MAELHRRAGAEGVQGVYMQPHQTVCQAYLGELILHGLTVGAPQVLRDGSSSAIFFNHARLLTEPNAAARFTSAMAGYLKLLFPMDTLLANADSKSGGHLVGPVSEKTGMRQALVVPAQTAAAEGTMGRRVWLPASIAHRPPSDLVIVDDVATGESTMVPDIVEEVQRGLAEAFPGAKPPQAHLLVGVARRPNDMRRGLAPHNIQLHSVATAQEVLARAWPGLDSQQQELAAQEFPGLPSQA